MKKLLFVVLLLPFVISGGYFAGAGKQQSPPIMLQASEVFFMDVLAMATGNYEGQQRFYVFHSNSIIIYNEEHSVLSRVDTSGNFYPTDPVVDSEGKVYLINSATDEIGFLRPTGQWGGSFRVQERPYSLAVLSNGNLVIASPNGDKLFHIYDTSGRKLRSFGDIKHFDVANYAQNLFLNRGKVVVDSSDNIYFVFKYAPTPTVLKFSRKGKFISEFAVEGYAINLQAELARKYLSTKPSNEVGSIVLTNSATIDPSTGHLWICMNGSSKSGVVYEYSRKGKKLGEYSVIRALPSIRPHALTHVTDLLVRTPTIYLNVDNEIYSVDSKKALAPGDSVFPQEEPPCPQAQSWPGCSANCPTGSCPASINCKAILQGQIGQGLRIVGSSCQSLGPGQGTPTAKPNGGCIANVTTCDTTTGEQVTHTTNQDCNPTKYACSGTACVAACDGTFTTSNCNNTCAGGGGNYPFGCGSCDYQRETDCASYNGFWGNCCCLADSPILIDTLGNGFALTDASGGVDFDFDGNGTAERLAWTAPGSDDAWLVLDRNGNGLIDNGQELFGNLTPQPSSSARNGFLALAEYDEAGAGGNRDGAIDHRDAIFSSLRLWLDSNHNGISEPSELHTLPQLGVHSIDLKYKESKKTDQYGNHFRYRAKVKDEHGAQVGRWAWDVFLVTQ
ncbi:MAG: hypothetical protein AABN34_26660 [Acidobacteriota bacterium]